MNAGQLFLQLWVTIIYLHYFDDYSYGLCQATSYTFDYELLKNKY